MSFIIKYVLFVFLLIFAFCSCSKKIQDNSQRVKVLYLISDAVKFKDTIMNNRKADSLLDEALKFALVSNDDFLISAAYSANLKYRSEASLPVILGKEYFSQAVNSANNLKDDSLISNAYLQYCHFLIEKKLPKDALNYLNIMPEPSSNNDFYEVKKLLLQSEINKIDNQPYEQLRNLMDANYKAYDVENYDLKNETDKKLSEFYLNEKKYENALEYNDKIKQSINSRTEKDSVQWYYAEANRLLIITQYIDNKAAIEIARKINDFGIRKNIPKLSFYAQSSLRTYFIDKLDFQSLENWYKKYPSQLQELKEQNISYYYRVKAYFAENKKDLDSASFYFDASLKANQSQNSYSLYNYYLRKGDFEKRNGNISKAYEDYEQSFDYSFKTNNYYNQISIGEELVQYFVENKNFEKESLYLTKLNEAKTNLIQFLSNENIRNIELSNILAQKELERKKILEKEERQHNQQYLLITLMIILVIMTMVVFSLYSVPKWWIKSMGYISFLMFFEFIILLIDGWLHHKTHGEPWKILLFKVILLSVLFPLHHWIEKTFVNLLLQDDLRNFVKKNIFRNRTSIKEVGNIE